MCLRRSLFRRWCSELWQYVAFQINIDVSKEYDAYIFSVLSLTDNNIVTLKKALSLLTIPLLSCDEAQYCSPNKTDFLFSIPIGPDQAPSLSHFVESECPPTYVTQPIPHLTHFKPVEGGSMFLRNTGISLPDYTVSQPNRPQAKILIIYCVTLEFAYSDAILHAYEHTNKTSEWNQLSSYEILRKRKNSLPFLFSVFNYTDFWRIPYIYIQ
jgi:hypothetical protein